MNYAHNINKTLSYNQQVYQQVYPTCEIPLNCGFWYFTNHVQSKLCLLSGKRMGRFFSLWRFTPHTEQRVRINLTAFFSRSRSCSSIEILMRDFSPIILKWRFSISQQILRVLTQQVFSLCVSSMLNDRMMGRRVYMHT